MTEHDASAPEGAPQDSGNDPALAAEPLASEHTGNFPQLLAQLGISLLVTTYQAGRLIVVRNDNGKLNTHFRVFNKPMGMAADAGRFSIGTALEIKSYRNVPMLCQKLEKPANAADDWQPPTNPRHDAAYVPASSHVTGDIDIHEMAYGKNHELWFINTRFSTLCTLDGDNNFVPRWRPRYVTELAPEDRCHLNGLAMAGGQPQYVTALGCTNTPQGWREDKAHGGVLMDVARGHTLVAGLSMPHSPRVYNDSLWVLESGNGSIAKVQPVTGQVTTLTQLPGFTRGVDFHGPLAFIGLSQVRETAVFSGIPITERLAPDQRRCGVWVVNILTGETVAYLRFKSGVQEIFAVSVVPARFPEVLEPSNELIKNTYVVPDVAMRDVPKGVGKAGTGA